MKKKRLTSLIKNEWTLVMFRVISFIQSLLLGMNDIRITGDHAYLFRYGV